MPTTGCSKQYAVNVRGGALGQRFVNAMQRVPRLKSDDIVVPVTFKDAARFGRGSAYLGEVQTWRELKYLQGVQQHSLCPSGASRQ